VAKRSPQIWATVEIFKKLPKVNNRPKGENSPDLVTLFRSNSWSRTEIENKYFDPSGLAAIIFFTVIISKIRLFPAKCDTRKTTLK
jgi:hypothetical protein